MTDESTIYVVDDDEAVRRALAGAGRLLDRPVRSFASAAEFLAAYAGGPGCLVLDIKMPGMTGIELQQKLASDGIPIPLIVVSGHADVRTAVDVMVSGAVTLLEKPFRLEELLGHIRRALDQDSTSRSRTDRQTAADARLGTLTQKEREVLDAVTAGKTNREIAADLGLSLRAVEDRRSRLMRKLDVRTLAELVQLVSRSGGA
jgi:FixJ family two-component response regulator